jgi:1,3-beta-glucan synthase component
VDVDAGAEDDPGQVVEVYRVRLPSQKQDKRGVVRHPAPQAREGSYLWVYSLVLIALVMVACCVTSHVLQILGEGKPENQNCAMIFCFGECIQTVDMNQENHLAEAFKMRNLLRVRASTEPEGNSSYPTQNYCLLQVYFTNAVLSGIVITN